MGPVRPREARRVPLNRAQDNGTVNPLLEIQFRVPFDQIRAEHVEPAIQQLLEEFSKCFEGKDAFKKAELIELAKLLE